MAFFQIINEGVTLLRRDKDINKDSKMESDYKIPTQTLLEGPIVIDPINELGHKYQPNSKHIVSPILFLEIKEKMVMPLSVKDLNECLFNFVTISNIYSFSYSQILVGVEVKVP